MCELLQHARHRVRAATLLDQMARASARHPRIREKLLCGPLEYILDAPKARALALKRLSPQGAGLPGKPVESRGRKRQRAA